jgi:hypothetical protein
MPERLWQMCQGISGLGRTKEEAMLKKLAEPTALEQAMEFAGAVVRRIRQGSRNVTDEQYETRLAMCDNCPADACDKADEHWKCRECGCPIKEGSIMPGKARWASEDCPKGFWPKIELSVVSDKPCGCGNR